MSAKVIFRGGSSNGFPWDQPQFAYLLLYWFDIPTERPCNLSSVGFSTHRSFQALDLGL
jgi:hypothetical protein